MIDNNFNLNKKNILMFILLIYMLISHFTLSAQTEMVKIYEKKSAKDDKITAQKLKIFRLDDFTQIHDSLAIRIWAGRHIVEIRKNKDSISGKLINFAYRKTTETLPVYEVLKIHPAKTKQLLDSLLTYHITSLPGDDMVFIHGQIYEFEISHNRQYRYYSYSSPSDRTWTSNRELAAKIIQQTYKQLKIDSLDRIFLNHLPPGEYEVGWNGIRVDYFCKKSMQTSSLYRYIKDVLKQEFDFDETKNHTEFPLIILNGKSIKMCDLNRYKYRQLKKIKVYKKNAESHALYGINARYGVVDISLKKHF